MKLFVQLIYMTTARYSELYDGCERTIAASNKTDREDSGRKREQTVVSRAAGVDEQQQQATGQPDGEDSGRK